MAYRKRTQNRPEAGQEFPEDASRYSRREYEGCSDCASEEGYAYGEDGFHAGANPYSRYNAASYSSRAAAHRGAGDSRYRDPSPEAGSGEDRVFGRGAGRHAVPEGDPFAYDPSQGESYGYSRDGYAQRSARYTARRKRRMRIRALVIALALVLVAGVGTAFAYVHSINGNLSEGLDPNLKNVLVKSNITKEPFYMLLLGTDASMERKNDESYAETFRTDTILLARIDPVEKNVSLISMPRDTMIDMGENGTQKLNAAYAIGGADDAVTEVSELAGVGISHFCLIDMDGLTSVVDSLGGIEVDVPMEIDDPDAGGHLDAGPQTLNGEQALILCRSRNAFSEYGAGDIYRAANQRLVLQAIASKILSSDVGTIAKTVTALTEFISTDLSVNDIIGLAQAFQGINAQDSIYTDSMPTTSSYIDELWYEVVDEEAWKTMMERVDSGLPPEESSVVDERAGVILANSGSAGSESEEGGSASEGKSVPSGSVSVRNGTDVTGAGSSTLSLLESEGYKVADAADADATDYQSTLVIYGDESQKADAEAIAALLGPTAQAVLNDGTYSTSSDFLVVIGADLAADLAAS